MGSHGAVLSRSLVRAGAVSQASNRPDLHSTIWVVPLAIVDTHPLGPRPNEDWGSVHEWRRFCEAEIALILALIMLSKGFTRLSRKSATNGILRLSVIVIRCEPSRMK